MDLRGIELASISGSYVGGRRITMSGQAPRQVSYSGAIVGIEIDPNDTYHVEQAYLQTFVPVGAGGRPPILLVHGGGYTGACWETTPDGRPGWLTFFLRRGAAVSVLDNIERGRAGWCSLPGVWPDEPITRGERDMWVTFRFGPPDGYASRTPFSGTKFPVEALDAALTQSVPRWPGNNDLAFERLRDAVRQLGPCVLVGHSQGGGLCARAALAEPGLVRASVLLEPHGLPEALELPGTPVAGAGADGTAGAGGGPLPPMLTIVGDYIDASELWLDLVSRMHRFAAAARTSGAVHDIVDLPGLGITGNSHNMMMDTNSDEIAELAWAWLGKHADGQRDATA